MAAPQDEIPTMDELQAELARKHGRVLSSPEGKELVAYLERAFYDAPLVGKSPELTYFNLGAREVVRRMRRIARALTTE
jgi:hypothetical protein